MTLKDYKKRINNATTKDELRQITYDAFLQDDNALRGNNSLYNKVITLCIQREVDFGLI